ncbi:MAG: hypothetical protein AB1515_10790, partial [Nitrospirota bacterium]
ARSHGFLDPVAIRARLNRFAQPSEVAEPLELLRSGMVFHARGLINTRAIQHNLDWIWPFWVERQFNPADPAFIPRAFSMTHVNLTHRNWTAVGVPGVDQLPIVDPRGLVTPFWDGWSLDGWIVAEDGRALIPSRLAAVRQRLRWEDGVSVETLADQNGLSLASCVDVTLDEGGTACRLRVRALADAKAWAVIALRPYNPEGVSFIHEVGLAPDRSAFIVDGAVRIEFGAPPERHAFSYYRMGDVGSRLLAPAAQERIECDVGMATAAALFALEPGQPREIAASVPLAGRNAHPVNRSSRVVDERWADALRGCSLLRAPDTRAQFLYEAALRSMILHTPGDVYPGPYTYKRFWFRDAAFIVHALLCAGLIQRAESLLDRFPGRQQRSGYFHSQEGEWDSNGQVLWIMERFCRLAGRPPKPEWLPAVTRGAEWIVRKRLPDGLDVAHAGLLPAGFSAEHLGPNDYYYWDDFWGVAGLRAAADLLVLSGEAEEAEGFHREAAVLMAAIERSLEKMADRRAQPGIPASPYRRMDAGAIGSLAAGYPLQLWPARDPRLLDTAELLLRDYSVLGGFFQNMIHSGVNPYLTLHLAQVLLRAGDPRCIDLTRAVAELASPTGQWPEAIHPGTRGGCMGDGQHMWAAAEWVLMMRNSFMREEAERLVLASGIPDAWLASYEPMSFGPAPTPHGELSVTIESEEQPGSPATIVSWQGRWRGPAPTIEVRLPGHEPVICAGGEDRVSVTRRPPS